MPNKGRRTNPAKQETCSIKGCKRPYCASGLCRLHYERRRRQQIGMKPRPDQAKRKK